MAQNQAIYSCYNEQSALNRRVKDSRNFKSMHTGSMGDGSAYRQKIDSSAQKHRELPKRCLLAMKVPEEATVKAPEPAIFLTLKTAFDETPDARPKTAQAEAEFIPA